MKAIIFFGFAVFCSVDTNQQPTQDCITVPSGRYSLYENCTQSLRALDARVKQGQAGSELESRRFLRQSVCEPREVPAVPYEEWSKGQGGRQQ